jgi:nitrogenase molybdenum-iron cofactor biosynthesis protein NifE
MLQHKLQHLFDEPACARNRAKDDKTRKKGCGGKPLSPGNAAGGCAFDGAKIVLQPIADAAHLVHGPIACEGNSWDSRHSLSSGPLLYRTSFTTDMGELDVIYGGEKRLYRAIKEVIARTNPPAVFVYQTCLTAMIGDDIEKVCAAATERFGRPVIAVNAPGFVGKKNFGTKLAGEVLLNKVIGTEEPDFTTPTDINLIGEYNVSGDLWNVTPLLARLGIRLVTAITGDGHFHDIAKAHRARLNMMVCSQALVNVARKMEERWGIPWFEGSFYGVPETSKSLRTIARMLVERGAEAALIGRTEALIAEEEARVAEALKDILPVLRGKKALLYTGGVKSWSMIAALQWAGMSVIGTSVRKATEGDKSRASALMGEAGDLYESLPQSKMYQMLKAGEADIMLSGGRTQYVALKAKVPWVDSNQERHASYTGYAGAITLFKAIHKELTSPVWAQLRTPAPWEM